MKISKTYTLLLPSWTYLVRKFVSVPIEFWWCPSFGKFYESYQEFLSSFLCWYLLLFPPFGFFPVAAPYLHPLSPQQWHRMTLCDGHSKIGWKKETMISLYPISETIYFITYLSPNTIIQKWLIHYFTFRRSIFRVNL